MINKHIRAFIVVASLFFFLLGAVAIYLWHLEGERQAAESAKKQSVALIGLPDLALSTETRTIRHRSLADLFSIFSEDGSLQDYFPSSYVYALPPYQHAHSAIIRKEKIERSDDP